MSVQIYDPGKEGSDIEDDSDFINPAVAYDRLMEDEARRNAVVKPKTQTKPEIKSEIKDIPKPKPVRKGSVI